MNTASPTFDSPDLIAQLWAGARHVLARLVNRFGAPIDIAARTHMNARERAHLREWLCALETFVRKIVLMEAERMGPPPPTRPGLSARTSSTPTQCRRHYAFKLWVRPRPHPARLRLLGEAPREIARDRASRDRIDRLREANRHGDFQRAPEETRLARRISALARVLQSPQTYARRLARRLARMPKLAIILATSTPYVSLYIDEPLNEAAGSGSHKAAARLNPRPRDTS